MNIAVFVQSLLWAVAAVAYVEIGARMVIGGVQRAPGRISAPTRVILMIVWPLALIYGAIALFLMKKG